MSLIKRHKSSAGDKGSFSVVEKLSSKTELQGGLMRLDLKEISSSNKVYSRLMLKNILET